MNYQATRAHRVLTTLFGKPEEINGHGRCPTYCYRWRILGGSTREGHKTGRAVYIHHFVGDDWALDCHDHPKRFISVGLKGGYLETTPKYFPTPEQTVYTHRWYRAPWVRTFPATHIHRLQVPSTGCWTLIVTLKSIRDWGFWHLGEWIEFSRYVGGDKKHLADLMKSCAD